MKALVYIPLDDEDNFEFLLDFADRPVPRVGELVDFDAMVTLRVTQVVHYFEAYVDRDHEIWLRAEFDGYQLGGHKTPEGLREILSKFPSVKFK